MNHSLCGPLVIAPLFARPCPDGSGKTLSRPAVVIRPMTSLAMGAQHADTAVNQSAPSGPVTISLPITLARGSAYVFVTIPAVDIRPIVVVQEGAQSPAVNHRAPSGPAVMPRTNAWPVG